MATARGQYRWDGVDYEVVDLPGTYSLAAHSEEEAVARDFIQSGQADAVVVVCDATCLERNLILVLQVLELTGKEKQINQETSWNKNCRNIRTAFWF